MARRGSALFLAIGAFVLLFWAGFALAAGSTRVAAGTAAAPTTTSSTGTGASGGAVISLKHGSEAAIVVVVVVALLVVVWFGLILFDRIRAERRMDKYLPTLIEQASRRDSDPPLTTDQVKLLARVIAESPRGATGLTRTVLALGLISLIGMALIALIVGDGSHASDLLKSIVTALTAALTTILGFYFGAKTAQDAAAAAPAVGQGLTPAPSTGGSGNDGDAGVQDEDPEGQGEDV